MASSGKGRTFLPDPCTEKSEGEAIFFIVVKDAIVGKAFYPLCIILNLHDRVFYHGVVIAGSILTNGR
jgi:hypothetical protein